MPSNTYNFTGGWTKFTVPRGVKELRLTLNGAGSGDIAGGRVTGKLAVARGQVIFIGPGEAGKFPTGTPGAASRPGTATFGGGAAGGYGAAQSAQGGAGATVVRRTSTTGALVAVAGGAGGTSGDAGVGGRGGADIGENGFPGVPDASVPRQGNATGGTQIQGGNGGTSAVDAVYNGGDARDAVLAPAGIGGGVSTGNPALVYGGGGGGGGYHPGGGGMAGVKDLSAAGGGGGGSNYREGLTSFATSQGGGALKNGSVVVEWTAPRPANQPPSPPTEVKLADKDYTGDEHVTLSTGALKITAKVDDPVSGQTVRLVVIYSADRDFSSSTKTVLGNLVGQTKRSTVNLTGLRQDTLYFARLYTRDSRGLQSVNFTSVNFWTNRAPLAPELRFPAENQTVSELDSVPFEWNFVDPDVPPDETATQGSFVLQWRTSGSFTTPAGAWTTVAFTTRSETYVADAGTFKGNVVYEWQVRTADIQGLLGPFSIPSSFFITGAALHPVLVDPVADIAVDVTLPTILAWKFRDPDTGDTQYTADLRYRAAGTSDWVVKAGTPTLPGAVEQWVLPPDTFVAGVHYEWQVRTTDRLTHAVSAWSDSGFFWAIGAPGAAVLDVSLIPSNRVNGAQLGCGHNKVYAYVKGGQHMLGEITPLVSVEWGRLRDDLSHCQITTAGFRNDCGEMLASLRTWMHELVVFRDGVRVWEGPITRIQDTPQGLTIEAKDVMVWPYRRIMRQGYNDAFRVVNGVEFGDFTVVERARLIILNALARDDPNVIPYLTTFNFPDDAGQSRIVPDYSKTSWEEVDDLAATAGLDYTTVGRRIILWDTHRAIGKLQELRNDNFSNSPIVTEYGMLLATTYAVTNNSGIFGVVERDPLGYGPVELLASAFGESEADAGAVVEEVLTSEARLALEKVLTSQAERGIASRYPAPVQVRVPDGSTLTPETEVDINHLIPGVWVPLRASGTLREIAQWQKLDVVNVTETADEAEKVSVTFSPAPNGGQDPDSEALPAETA